MTLKLWDINKESAPVMTYMVHEPLRARVCVGAGVNLGCVWWGVLVLVADPRYTWGKRVGARRV